MICKDCGMETENRVIYSNHTRRGCIVGRGTWHQRNRERVREYSKKWRLENRDGINRKQRIFVSEWRKRNPDKVRLQRYKTRDNLRTDVLMAYGNKCICCGESTRQFLAIDHINNDGAKHKRQNNLKSAQAFYTWLRKNNYPKDNFQILCHNCNMAKGFYGACPHEINRNSST
jgi:hypothetical protein